LEQVNRIHEAMSKLVVEAFTNDDFIYTTAWLGLTRADASRSRLRMGCGSSPGTASIRSAGRG
jgi:hypothetical protein